MLDGRRILVTGVLTRDSIAFATALAGLGAPRLSSVCAPGEV